MELPPSRGRRSPPELFTHYLTLALSLLLNANAFPQLTAHDIVQRNWNPKLSSKLGKIVRSTSPSAKVVAISKLPTTIDGRLKVIVVPEVGLSNSIPVTRIKKAGGEVLTKSTHLIEVAISPDSLSALAAIESVGFVRLPMRPKNHAVSEGLALMNADRYHTNGVKGEGVKLAIIDGGFEGAMSLAGDLNTWRFHDFTGEGIYEGGKHGTAVAEIVYDVAPDASLYLYRVSNLVQLENAKDRCISEGIKIINFSLGWSTTGIGDGQGHPCEIADDAAKNGILWVNSAGNSADRQYRGQYLDSDNDGWHNFDGDTEVLSLLNVERGDEIDVSLVWNDFPTTFANYDLILYRTDDSGQLERVEESTSNQFGSGPFESIEYHVEEAGDYKVAVSKNIDAPSLSLRIVSEKHRISGAEDESMSIDSPGDAAGSLSVGAVSHWNWARGPIAPYSSRGPTFDGRIKPDLVAPSSVVTASYSRSFSGTSAAAPHVSGVAALLLSANPGFTRDDLRDELLSSTVDLGPTGRDNAFGFGKLVLADPPRFSTSVHTLRDGHWIVDDGRVNKTNGTWWFASYTATSNGIVVRGTAVATFTNNTSNTQKMFYSIAFLDSDNEEIADRFQPADREIVLEPDAPRELVTEFTAGFSGLGAAENAERVTYFASFEQVGQAYSTSGRVTLSGQSIHSGVTISFTRVSGSGSIPSSVQTRSNGTWDQRGFMPGTTYRALPRRSGWRFSPASTTFSSARSNLNFAGTVTTYSTSGRVTLSGQSIHSGVTISFTRVSGSGSIPSSVQTRSNGTWDQRGFMPGTTYRALPRRSGWRFSPASTTFSSARSNLNFAGTVTTYSTSGRVTLSGQSIHSGVTISFTRVSGSGSIPSSVQTRSNGTWDQRGFMPGTTYRALPRRSGWRFSPASTTFSSARSNLNFAGSSLVVHARIPSSGAFGYSPPLVTANPSVASFVFDPIGTDLILSWELLNNVDNTLTVWLNGFHMWSIPSRSNWTTWYVPIPDSSLRASENVLEFRHVRNAWRSAGYDQWLVRNVRLWKPYNAKFVGVDRLNEIVSSRFILGDPFPTPFNAAVSVPIHVLKAERVSVRIFNLLGQRVSTLYEGQLEPGSYSFVWDARDSTGHQVTTGIYLVVAEVGTQFTTKRTVYIK